MKAPKEQLVVRVIELEKAAYLALRPIVPKEWLNVDLTMPQFRIVLLLFTDGPARVSALASALDVSLATTTGITDRLVQHGFIVKENDPEDGRAVICQLSGKGREVIARLWELRESRVRSLLERIPLTKLEVVSKAMKTILEAASVVERDTQTR